MNAVIMVICIVIHVNIFITREITQSISYIFICKSYTLNSDCVLVHTYVEMSFTLSEIQLLMFISL